MSKVVVVVLRKKRPGLQPAERAPAHLTRVKPEKTNDEIDINKVFANWPKLRTA